MLAVVKLNECPHTHVPAAVGTETGTFLMAIEQNFMYQEQYKDIYNM